MHSFVAIFHNAGDLGNRLLDLLFPPRCIGCSSVGTWLCARCVERLPYIVGPVCERCGLPLQRDLECPACRRYSVRVDGIRSVLLFEGAVRTAIHRLKYRNGRMLAGPFGQLMAAGWDRLGIEVDVIVPVPLHPQRLRQRGYNQAALLARELARHTGLPSHEGALSRVRHTASQMALDAAARRDNVRGAFRCTDGQLRGRRVLLIDDVCTTGATLDACADALRAAGAIAVWGFTLARAP